MQFPEEACLAYLDPSSRGLLRLQRIAAVLVAPNDALVVPLLEAHPDFERLKAFPELLVYRHTGFQEPAWFVERTAPIEETPRIAALMQLDVTRDAIVTADATTKNSKRYEPGNTVTEFHENQGEIDVAVSARSDGFLVVNTTWYPGWKAWVDGAPTPVSRVNASFMGVAVPAGSTSIRLLYRPEWILWLTATCLAVWLILLGIGIRIGWRALS
jgi:hypothetical protein